MSRIPAICNACHTVFPSGFAIGKGPATFKGCTSGPCPNCGGEGAIVDGVYDVVQGTMTYLRQLALGDVRQLRQVVESIKREDLSPEAAKTQVENAAPGLSRFIPKNATELVAYLGLIIVLLRIMFGDVESGSTQQENKVEIVNVIEKEYQATDSGLPNPVKERSENSHSRLHEGENFSGVAEVLDGNEYIGCTFDKSTLSYKGGEMPRMRGCTFRNCLWLFDDAAARTLAFMRNIYHSSEEGKRLIEEHFDSIRRPFGK